jgi:sulfate permease, SulP family
VLVGYMTGIAVLMVASQLGTLTGVEVHGDSFRSYLSSFAAHMDDVRTATPVVAATVLLFLVVAGRAAPN